MKSYSVFLITPAAAKLLQSCPTLCDPVDRSPPGPAVPGILQARTLEWVAISLSLLYPTSIIFHKRFKGYSHQIHVQYW